MRVFIFFLFFIIAETAYAFVNISDLKNKYERLININKSRNDIELQALGDSALNAGDVEKALVYYMLICARADTTLPVDKLRTCVDSHIKIGNIYFFSGNYTNALDFYLKGFELSDSSPDKPYLGILYNNLGNVYSIFQEHEQAIRQYEEGLKYCGADSVLRLKICQNMTCSYIDMHNVEKAKYYHDMALKIPCDYAEGQYMNDFGYAAVLYEEKRYQEAIDLFAKTARFAQENNLEPKYECYSYGEIYKAYMELGEKDSVLYYLDKCNKFATQNGIIYMFTKTYRHLADFYEKEGDIRKALHLRSIYLQLKDSIFDVRSFDMLKNQQLTYEMDKTEREIHAQKELVLRHNEIIRWQLTVIIITVTGIILVVVLLINVYRKKNELDMSYRNLFQLNKQLAENYNMAKDREQKLQALVMAGNKEIERLQSLQDNRDAVEAAGINLNEATQGKSSSVKYSSSNLNENRQAELLDKISHVMEEQKAYCNIDFSLDLLASLVESNSRYVSQAINDAYGKNFSNYVNEYRVRLACERLSDIDNFGTLTIRAIGESVGFKSHTTFIGVFKKATGMTPSIYSRIAKEKTEE